MVDDNDCNRVNAESTKATKMKRNRDSIKSRPAGHELVKDIPIVISKDLRDRRKNQPDNNDLQATGEIKRQL